ncbi:MAG: hypothetical protein KC475_00320 [Cyanobacteria bacterium HKST-UBA03]|nr:hypothetical protein [Cyanobacteria bacterium HKST-UBA03]
MTLNVALIAETFQRAKRENGGTRTLGLRFYERLFEKYPAVRPLFKASPEEQHTKLMASVGAIVASVTKPDVMLPYLHAMGIRHLQYKTEVAHYPAVQENFVAVLGEHLSQEGEWTDEMEQNWNAAMETVSNIMIEAANQPEQYKEEMLQAGYLPNGFKVNNSKPWELVSV